MVSRSRSLTTTAMNWRATARPLATSRCVAWITRGYFRGEGGNVLDKDGWFTTGDVATLDEDGYMQITDRSKDVIKSGGEWISSIDLENAAVGHPAVQEAAVIGVHHEKWQERPLLLVIKKAGQEVTRDEMLSLWKAALPSGGCPTMWSSSPSCRIPPPASC